jgi:prolyl 4-hydroxylase
MSREIPTETVEWIVRQARLGQAPDMLLKPLLDDGWKESEAIAAVEQAVRLHLDVHARESGLPPSVPVPNPIDLNGPSTLQLGDRRVHVLASMLLPRVVVFGGLLGDDECDELVAMSGHGLQRSSILDPDTGADTVHDDRTSAGTHFPRGGNPLVARIEARIAMLLDWPVENGEAIQVLRYGPGAEYRPHHDYFDPVWPGSAGALERGGQRVGSLVMYLNTPECGGATTFPESRFEVAAVKGNAVFFSYDRPHPMTRTLHAGAPVLQGEKWIATKWLRERRHD